VAEGYCLGERGVGVRERCAGGEEKKREEKCGGRKAYSSHLCYLLVAITPKGEIGRHV